VADELAGTWLREVDDVASSGSDGGVEVTGHAGEVNCSRVVEQQSESCRGLQLCMRPLCCYGCIAFACVPAKGHTKRTVCCLYVHREDACWVRA
jgi:hypothetical protein